jgi:bifunctional UDP-N-acetylglucosamine pyrophosphorylase/glucosamine-1-phosphate N-acetyltransferase
MKVAFLCGGVGKRMSPLSEDKFLLKFLGKTLLQYQIEQAGKASLNDFILIGNPSNIDKIKAITQSISGTNIALAVQEKPLGMANALESARHLLHNEPIIVVNPNDVFESSAYESILEKYKEESSSSYILAQEVREYFPGGYLVLGNNGEVKAIVEKPGKGNEPSNLVNMVVHLHTQPEEFLQYIASVLSSADDVYEQALSNMTKEGHKVKAIRYNAFWKAIKYPWDILSVMEHFLKQVNRAISPKTTISPTAVIEGEVLIEEGVRILENAVIKGPCYIGRNSIIGNNVLIRDASHIGEACVVGYGTEVKHCYIGDRCWFHRNYFGDSIIGNDCSFGAGTVTANLRLDEGNIKVKINEDVMDTGLNKLGAFIGNGAHTGINVSLMPGIKIGAGCFVGPHVCLNQDLAAGKMAFAAENYKVTNNPLPQHSESPPHPEPSSPSSLRGAAAKKQSEERDEIATPSARNDMEAERIED